MSNKKGENNNCNNHVPQPNRSRRIAFSGITSALALVFMLLGSIFPFATFTAPIMAGLCLIPIAVEFGKRTAGLAYIAISVLSFLTVLDYETSFFFIFLFGYYPILYPVLNKIRLKLVKFILKFTLFNVALVVVYSLLLFVFIGTPLRNEFAEQAPWFWIMLWVLGNITFFIYDVLVDRMYLVYRQQVQEKFFK